MSEATFPLHITQTLDRLTVPSLPSGFSDRLVARIAAGNLPADMVEGDLPLPVLRRPSGATGWRRSGRIVVVAATFGLATATAAAAGVFGEPVYIPVVSQALAKAQIVDMPIAKPAIKKTVKAEHVLTKAPEQLAETAASGKDAVLERIAAMRADPGFRKLPPDQRQERAKAEIAKLIADGTVQKADVKAAWMQLASERKEMNKARFEQGLSDRQTRLRQAKERAEPLRPKALTPEQKEKVRVAVNQLTDAQRAELQLLRQKRRDATLQERRAVQDEIHAFWQRVGVTPTAEEISSTTP